MQIPIIFIYTMLQKLPVSLLSVGNHCIGTTSYILCYDFHDHVVSITMLLVSCYNVTHFVYLLWQCYWSCLSLCPCHNAIDRVHLKMKCPCSFLATTLLIYFSLSFIIKSPTSLWYCFLHFFRPGKNIVTLYTLCTWETIGRACCYRFVLYGSTAINQNTLMPN